MVEIKRIKEDIYNHFHHFLDTIKNSGLIRNNENVKFFDERKNGLVSFVEETQKILCEPIDYVKRKELRKSDFSFYLHEFNEFYKEHFQRDLVYISEASDSLNDTYWEIIEKEVRTRLDQEHNPDPRINIFKMISTSECAILSIQPLTFENSNDTVFFNALFAINVGKSMLANWLKLNNVSLINTHLEKDHFTWLQLVSSLPTFPIFSNAQVWEYFATLCKIQLVLDEV
jgi:hypothetical protein